MNTSIFMPLYKAIDKVFFGIDDFQEIEKEAEHFISDNDEDFVAEKSNNYQLLVKE